MRLNVVALEKNSGEQFVFLFDDESHDALLETFRRYAEDESMDFSWEDAATLAAKFAEVMAAEGGVFAGSELGQSSSLDDSNPFGDSHRQDDLLG